MRIRSIEALDSRLGDETGSIVLRQEFSHARRRLRACVLVGSGGLGCLPFALLLVDAGARSRVGELVSIDPMAMAQLGIALAIALAALFYGAFELTQPEVRKRLIRIEKNQVIVDDTARGGSRRWQEPMESYRGIRHRVHTTSAGTIHTLMLEHAHAARSLHIAYETHIANQAIVEAASRFDLPVLHAGDTGSGAIGEHAIPAWFARLAGGTAQGSHMAST